MAMRENEILPFAAMRMELEGIRLSEISQSEKDRDRERERKPQADSTLNRGLDLTTVRSWPESKLDA